METRRRTEKNRIRNKIREITNYIETDTNTINRLKNLQTNIDFNKRKIEQLYIKNEERKEMIEELNRRSEDLDFGKLDDELNEEYETAQQEIKRKESEAMKKKKDLQNIKKEDKLKFEAQWKATVTADKENRYSKYDIERGEKYFFKLCNSIPEYMIKKLKTMPNNKGYIWKGIYCFGELPPDNENKTVIFERQGKGVLRIHEWHPDVIEIWEKPERGRRILISQTSRKQRKTLHSSINW